MENILALSTLKPLSRLVVKRRLSGGGILSTELDNVSGYRLSRDRKFGSATLDFSVVNPDGDYSYDVVDAPTNNVDDATARFITLSDSALNEGEKVHLIYRNIHLGPSYLALAEDETFGTWTTEILSADSDNINWSYIRVLTLGSFPSSFGGKANMTIEARFGDTPVDIESSDWIELMDYAWTIVGTKFEVIPALSAGKKYIQIRVKFYSEDGKARSRLMSIRLSYFDNIELDLTYNPLLYWGNEVEFYEGIVGFGGEKTWFKKFTGVITTVSPDLNEEGSMVRVECMDRMKWLVDEKIEKPNQTRLMEDKAFEPEKILTPTGGLELDRLTAEDGIPEEEVGHIYAVPEEYRNNPTITNIDEEGEVIPEGDLKYINWASSPTPEIFINGVYQHDGYEIDNARGRIYFAQSQPEEDVISAFFGWYNKDSNRFEEVVSEIIQSALFERGYIGNWILRDDVGTIVSDINDLYLVNSPYVVNPNDPKLRWELEPYGIKITLDMSFPRATVPRTFFDILDGYSHFDALQQMLQYVDPSYRVFVDNEGNFIGRYQPQKILADHNLQLKTKFDIPSSDDNIYTKIVVHGRKEFGINVAPHSTITILNDGLKTRHGRDADHSPGDGFGHLADLVNLNLRSNVGWTLKGRGADVPKNILQFQLSRPIKLGRVDFLWGARDVYNEALEEMQLTASVSNDGIHWIDLSRDQAPLSGVTSQWVSYYKNNFSDEVNSIFVQYLRIRAMQVASLKVIFDWFSFFALREVQIWEDDTIRTVVDIGDIVDYSNSPPRDGFISPATEERLRRRIGNKTLVLPMNETLDTEEKTRARGRDILYDMCRHLNTSTVDIVYSPHLEAGMTVKLENDKLGVDRLYYIEAISYAKDGEMPSVSLDLVSWD